MRQGLYVVYDMKVGSYSHPYFSQSDQSAVRTFGDALTQGDSMMARHPEDFVLFRIADVDDGTAKVTVPLTPEEVFRGRDVESLKPKLKGA